MSPQTPKFNRVTWRKVEHQVREIGKLQTIKVITIVFLITILGIINILK